MSSDAARQRSPALSQCSVACIAGASLPRMPLRLARAMKNSWRFVNPAMTMLSPNFFDRYARLVLTIGFRALKDHAEAEDLVQEVFSAHP